MQLYTYPEHEKAVSITLDFHFSPPNTAMNKSFLFMEFLTYNDNAWKSFFLRCDVYAFLPDQNFNKIYSLNIPNPPISILFTL